MAEALPRMVTLLGRMMEPRLSVPNQLKKLINNSKTERTGRVGRMFRGSYMKIT